MKKKILRVLAVLLVAYAAWQGWQAASFKHYRGAARPAGGVELEGVYHVHSRFSDGRADVDAIAAAAAARGLDFVILTDHGNPNAASLAAQGRRNGVLVLAGSEISTSRGHMVALSFEADGRAFDQNADAAAYQVLRAGGFSVVAHPYSKVRWSWGSSADTSGLELLNGDSLLKRNWPRVLIGLPLFLFKPEAVLLRLVDPSGAEFGKWDRLAADRAVYGYYAADAHFAYGAMFSLFHLHVLLNEPASANFATARSQIFDALRRGRFYNAVEAAAEADGFRFRAEMPERTVPLGGETRLAAGEAGATALVARTPFSFAHQTRILRDGLVVERSEGPECVHTLTRPGVYRVEVGLRERSPLDSRVPWIASNPIFIRKERP